MRLFTAHLELRVYVTPFLKSANTLLFISLFREGTVILIKYASKIFHFKVFLGAIDNIVH